MKNVVAIFSLIGITLLTGIETAEARAFCALRDPINSIRTLFPQASQHRSIVRAIDSDTRDKISEQLPFTLHFNELGKHTLYVAELQRKPIGYIHVRSELSEWGLIEIAWAMQPDLTLQGAYFQRCRIPDCRGEFSEIILSELTGKSFGDISSMLTPDGQSLNPRLQKKFEAQESLALATIRSALKTIAVTAIAWRKEVIEINRQLLIESAFGSHQNISLNPMTVDPQAIDDLRTQMGGAGGAIDKESIEVFQVSRDGHNIARIASADWRDRRFHGVIISLMDESAKVLTIRSVPAWPDAKIADAFNSLPGRTFTNGAQCSTAAEVVGYELNYLMLKSSRD